MGVPPRHWMQEMAGTQGSRVIGCGDSHRASDSSSKTLRFPLGSHRAGTMGRVPTSSLQTGPRPLLFYSFQLPELSGVPTPGFLPCILLSSPLSSMAMADSLQAPTLSWAQSLAHSRHLINVWAGTGEMAQQLRALAALPENPS